MEGCENTCAYLVKGKGSGKSHYQQNSSLIGGNGEKVQTLIAGTFDGYDAGKVKFFCQKLIHIMLKKGEIIVFCSLMRHILQFPACQKSSNP
jgi:hypothetical protein